MVLMDFGRRYALRVGISRSVAKKVKQRLNEPGGVLIFQAEDDVCSIYSTPIKPASQQ